MNRYFTEKVSAIQPAGGFTVRATFADGFSGSVDLSPLVDSGPLFEPLRDPKIFARVTLTRHGVPEWPENVDLSPGALRAWCEAGKFLDYEETDAWIEQHVGAPEKVA
ncbi:MAG: DUF2442 domain-containing protein [Chthoniobacteraceae bacterium]